MTHSLRNTLNHSNKKNVQIQAPNKPRHKTLNILAVVSDDLVAVLSGE